MFSKIHIVGGIIFCLLILAGLFVFDVGRKAVGTPVLDFADCELLGVVSFVLPKTCTTPDGQVFTEPTTNEKDLLDLIRVTTPRPEARIESPLVVEGFARGVWFFEGSFPVRLTDENGEVISTAIAYAQSEWMTEDFVPFRAELSYVGKKQGVGRLLLQKDNPSGDPARDQVLTMLLHFLGKYVESVATTTPTSQ